MLRYEVLFLTVPEITSSETDAVKDYFSKSIRDVKGTMLAFDRWGKYRLSYPVNKNDYGVYFLLRLDVAQEQRDALLEAINSAFTFKFNNLIVKNVVTRLADNEPAEYKRPESLEEAATNVDALIKNVEGDRREHRPRFNRNEKQAPVQAEVEETEIPDYEDEAEA
ncbi:30S ribosomal protein S6 [bacterium]|nr:30S ribosomal protein S6 [bacterium]